MKRLPIQISSLLGRVCTFGMALLGVTACSNEPELMYGSPTGSFEIKGAVTAESDGTSVAGASIVVKSTNSKYVLSNPVQTDSKGNYLTEESITTFSKEAKVRVVCTPTDASGLAADSVDVDLKFGGKKHNEWDMGHAESTVNFKLKAKSDKEAE